jgi:hypothetical protein
MLSHSPTPSTADRPRPDAKTQLPPPEVDPLAWIGAIDDQKHVLVIGGYGPGMPCALLRAGAAPVTHLFSHERPETGSASLVIVPRVPSLDWLATALPSIRRALVPNGRLVVRGGTQFNFLVGARRTLNIARLYFDSRHSHSRGPGRRPTTIWRSPNRLNGSTTRPGSIDRDLSLLTVAILGVCAEGQVT